jgi:thiol-disulfide isomerase/thioredoxin
LSVTIWAGIAHGQCEAPAAIREVLDRPQVRQEVSLTQAERDTKRTKILEDALAKYPHSYFLLASLMSSQGDKSQDAPIHWAETLRMQYPEEPVYVLMHAKALVGKNTPEAIRLLESLKTEHADMAQVYLELAIITTYGKFKDKARTQQELERFLQICPATLDYRALSVLGYFGTQEQIARTAVAVREHLENESDPLLRRTWEALWSLEFKARPPVEHEILRKQIAQDVARFEQSPARHQLEWQTFLRNAYQTLGDLPSVDRTDAEILKEHPTSQAAERIVQDRWQKLHPYPQQNADEAQLQAYYRASLAAAEEWHSRWPEDSHVLFQKFVALTSLAETTPEQIGSAANEFLTAHRRNPYWYNPMSPLEFQVAEAFIKYKIHLDHVPALVDEAYRAAAARNEGRLKDDRLEQDERTAIAGSITHLKLERAHVLLDYYSATKQPEKAREIEAELTSLDAPNPALNSELLERHAQAAEVNGRKLDALVLYRASKQARTTPAPAKDVLADNMGRLWKELGGTASAYPLLLDKPKVTEASESRWERPKNPLPAFALPDIEGKTWKLASLNGKAVLINIWATWCGPCRKEHPEFQKLYDKLKDRTDVAVLSFSVDEDIGKVAPYMKEHKYTFPVLLGKDLVDAVSSSSGYTIPQNWFVNSQGKLEWVQIGFDSDPKWQETTLAKLQEVVKEGR